MIHVALVSAYPTETEARAALVTEDPYLGIWTLPQPYGGRAHVFSDEPAEQLDAAGWTKEDAP